MYTAQLNSLQKCVPLYLLLCTTFIFADLPTDKCPEGCVCVKRDVKCYALTEFPGSFPPLTTYIYMDEMNIQDIPPDSFHGLSFLNTVEFHRSNFGSIPTCGFKGINSLEKIIFVKCVIGHLDKFAIFNITSPLSIEIKQSKITKMDSFAMTSLSNMIALTISETTFYEIRTHAFTNVTSADISISNCEMKKINPKPFMFVTVSKLEIIGNKFEVLPCGTFDSLLKISTGDNAVFTGNGILCDCGMNYVKTISDDDRKRQLGSMSCVENGEINKNKTVIEVLGGNVPCEQKSKEDDTKCRLPEITMQMPVVLCPSHTHGHDGYDHNVNDNKRNTGSQLNVPSCFGILFLIVVSLLT